MNNTIIIALLVIGLLFFGFMLPQLLLRRATRKVIKVFQQHNATSIKNAKPIDELGLRPQTMMDKLWKPRDYKSRALRFLISNNVVQITEDGKLYLAEENLAINLRRNY